MYSQSQSRSHGTVTMNLMTRNVLTPAASTEERIATYDWKAIMGELDSYGCAVLPRLLAPEECRSVAALYPNESHFRSHVIMARHGFGKGEYRYFQYPLPKLIGGIREWLNASLTITRPS